MNFNPAELGYELHSEDAQVINYRKFLQKDKEPTFQDCIELFFWQNAKVWIIGITPDNIKKFIPDCDPDCVVQLFVGKIQSIHDLHFIMSKIVTDAETIKQLGS